MSYSLTVWNAFKQSSCDGAHVELELIINTEMRVDLKGRHLSFTEIAKLVGENWQSLPPNEKEPYETQAFNMKEMYNAELAEYKKTENHRKYMEYLNEFKDKQAGVQHGM
jgi:hypothetical protein